MHIWGKHRTGDVMGSDGCRLGSRFLLPITRNPVLFHDATPSNLETHHCHQCIECSRTCYGSPGIRFACSTFQFMMCWGVFSHNTGYAFLNNQCLSASHLNSSVSLTNCIFIKHGSVVPKPFTLGTGKSILDYSSIGLENSELKPGLETRLYQTKQVTVVPVV